MSDPVGFDAVIEALNIFKKYGNPCWPFHCEHDVLYVMVEHKKVSEEDKKKLDELGFIPDDDAGHFKSFRYGSA